jgi:meso-butanediol dehydrogenase/(S,S)-butanediol dehydrogenase/diacetyl reductase
MRALEGKVALITGAGRRRGLGLAIATRLAADGCAVFVTDLARPRPLMEADRIGTQSELDAVATELRASGARAASHPLDVTDEASVDAAFAACLAEFGRLDILVNNAGIGYLIHPLADTPKSSWDAVLGVNLTGAFLCSRAAARIMIPQGRGGRIVNIASQAAKSGFPHMAAYVASKHGLVGLTRSSAIELGPHGITVNAVCPNHVTTGLGAVQNEYFSKYFGQTVDEYLAAMRRSIPMRREGLASDTAEAVAFLCSDRAQYVTGEAMNVSGGCEMH